MMILKCWKAARRTFESPLEAFGILWSGHRFVDILPNAMDECAGQHVSPFNRHIWGERSRSWGNKRHKLLDCFFRESHLTGASHGGSSWKSVLCRSECPSHCGRSSVPVPKQQLQKSPTVKWWSTSGWLMGYSIFRQIQCICVQYICI